MRGAPPAWLELVLLLAGAPARADEGAGAFLQDAVKAHGGEGALSLDGTVILKGAMKAPAGARMLPGERIVWRSGRDRLKYIHRVRRTTGMTETTGALDGDRAWIAFGGKAYDYAPNNLRTELAHDLDIILRAAAPGASSRDLGMVISGERTLRGVELTEGSRSTRLLFDPETHLLAEMEYKAIEDTDIGKSEERITRNLYGDYRPAGGAPFPHRISVYKDGVLKLEWEIGSVERGAAIDRSTFAKPEEEDERLYPEEFAN